MKKITLTLKMLLFVALLATWSSCSKSDDNEIVGPTPVNPTPNSEPGDPYMTVCEHVAEVAKQVKTYYKMSKDIGELASHAEEIEKIDYVNKVYFYNTTMFVDIEDFGAISYSYFPTNESEAAASKANKIIEKLKTRAAEEGYSDNVLGLEKAVVINQQHQDYTRQWARDFATAAHNVLESCNIDCTPNNNPSLDFFQNELFTYDIVLLITHGEWDPARKIHWLLTSESPSSSEKEDFDKDDLYKYKGFDRDNVSLITFTENRDGEETTVTNVKISEKFIDNHCKNFTHYGKVIFFNVACQSMMGGIPRKLDENKRDESLAEIMSNKGVGFYLGYDESSNWNAQRAGTLFMWKLVAGMSLRYAYETLPDECKQNNGRSKSIWVYDNEGYGYKTSKSWIADLLPYPSYTNGIIGISNSCITSSVLGKYTDNSTDIELKLVLKASSPLYYDQDFLKTINSSFTLLGTSYKNDFDYSKFLYGFEYSTNENFKDAKKTKGMSVNTTGCSLSDNKVSITQTLTNNELKSNTTYYYRAYFYDGFEYHYSKSDSFKTKTIHSGSGTEIPDVPGSEL